MRWWSVLLLVCTGCLSAYAPSPPVAPLLDEQGDVSVSGSIRAAGPKRGAAASIAVAPTKSTRVFVAGSFSHDRGDRRGDVVNHELREHVDQQRIEAGGGWGFSYRRLIVEALGGLAYARLKSAHCPLYAWDDSSYDCTLWMDERSNVVTGYGQVHAAAKFKYWTGGGGARLSLAHYGFTYLFGEDSKRTLLLPIFEPFMVQRVGFPWGKLELGINFPFLLSGHPVSHRPKGADSTQHERLFYEPGLRISLGLVFNIDELWRKR